MSWRNFLTPYVDKQIKSKDNSILRRSERSLSPISTYSDNKSRSSFDISRALKQNDVHYINDKYSEISKDNPRDQSQDINEITYCVSNTNGISQNSEINNNKYIPLNDKPILQGNIQLLNEQIPSNRKENHIFKEQKHVLINERSIKSKQKTSKNQETIQEIPSEIGQSPIQFGNKLAQIKNEMSQLKTEMSKFQKKKKNDHATPQVIVNDHATPNKYQAVNNNQNQINSLLCDSFQKAQERFYQKLQKDSSEIDLNMTKYEGLSFKKDKQFSCSQNDSFITDDDIQYIPDSLQDHLSNQKKLKFQKNSSHPLSSNKNSLNVSPSPERVCKSIFSSNLLTKLCIYKQVSPQINFQRHTQKANQTNTELSSEGKSLKELNKQLIMIESNLQEEREMRLQIQSKLLASNKEIAQLNSLLTNLQMQVSDFQQVVSDKNNNDKHITSQLLQGTSKETILNSKGQNIQPEGTMNNSPLGKYISSNNESVEKQRVKIQIFREDRNKLLEAFESVLRVIGKDKQKNKDSRIIREIRVQFKQVKEIRKVFKSELDQLRDEFLEIGHIDSFNLSCRDAIDALHELDNKPINIQLSTCQHQINISPLMANQNLGVKYPFQNFDSNKGTIQVESDNQLNKNDQISFQIQPQSNKYYSFQKDPLYNQNVQQHKDSIFNNGLQWNTDIQYHKEQQQDKDKQLNRDLLHKDSSNDNLNYSHTDMNSFYENLNETLNHSKNTVLDTHKLNRMLLASSTQQVPIQKTTFATSQLTDLQLSPSVQDSSQLFWDKPLQTKNQQSNYDTLFDSANHPNLNTRSAFINSDKPLKSISHVLSPLRKQFQENENECLAQQSDTSSHHNEELSFRQAVPIPLDLSQTTKNLKQRIINSINLPTIENTQENNDNNQKQNENNLIYNDNKLQQNEYKDGSQHLSLFQQYQQQQAMSDKNISHRRNTYL